jgi:charged multivesicular body protein 3
VQVKQWTTELRGQVRDMDRQIRHLERDEEKIKREIKTMAKRGEMSVVKMAAKNIIVIRKSEERLHVTKAQLNSVMMTLQTDLGAARAIIASQPTLVCTLTMYYMQLSIKLLDPWLNPPPS